MKAENVPAEKIAGFFNQYLSAVDWVRENKTASREEKLRRLIPPLCELKKINSPYPPGKEIPHRRFDDTFPFARLRVEPDDLDLEHLNYDRSKYEIDWMQDKISRATERGPGIWLYETKEEKELKERMRREEEKRRGFPSEDEFIHPQKPADLYEEWLPQLDQNRIQSRDLLDQILVCYTIKRALNGDQEAIERLYGLYVDAAEVTSVNFAKIFNLKGYLKNIKSDTKELLRFLISGFSPENIMKQLIDDGERGCVKSLPAWVKDFFIYYFSEYIPTKIQRNLEETRRIEKLFQDGMAGNNEIQEIDLKNRYIFLFFEWLSLLNPYAPIKDTLVWKNSPVRERRFNNYCFQPGIVKLGPYRNLTTWLFGRKGEIFYLQKEQPAKEGILPRRAERPIGKLLQLLKDKYIHLMKERAFDFNEDFDEGAKKYDGIQKQEKALLNRIEPIKGKETKKIKNELRKLGVSLRDADIYLRWKKDRLTQSQIAEEHNLSLRQTKRICRNVKTIIPTIKNFFLEE